MGAASSVRTTNFDSVNSSLRALYDTFLSSEDSNKMNQLHEDLARNDEVRFVFANYMWERGMDSLIIRQMTLAINESFMFNLLIQDMWEDERDYNSDIILYYISLFAVSSVYEPYYKQSAMLRTPPLSRSGSEVSELCIAN